MTGLGWSYLGLLLANGGYDGRVFALDGSNPNYWTPGSPPSMAYTPIAEPATLSLLAVGGLALARRRRAAASRPTEGRK